MKFLEEFCASQQFSPAQALSHVSIDHVVLDFVWTETHRCLLQTSITHCYVLYMMMISRNTLKSYRIARQIWVTSTNEFQQISLNHFARFKTKTSVLRAFEISYQLFSLRACSLSWDWGLVWIVVWWQIACLASKVSCRWVFRLCRKLE